MPEAGAGPGRDSAVEAERCARDVLKLEPRDVLTDAWRRRRRRSTVPPGLGAWLTAGGTASAEMGGRGQSATPPRTAPLLSPGTSKLLPPIRFCGLLLPTIFLLLPVLPLRLAHFPLPNAKYG